MSPVLVVLVQVRVILAPCQLKRCHESPCSFKWSLRWFRTARASTSDKMAVELAGEEAKASKISFEINKPGCETALKVRPVTGQNWDQDRSLCCRFIYMSTDRTSDPAAALWPLCICRSLSGFVDRIQRILDLSDPVQDVSETCR